MCENLATIKSSAAIDLFNYPPYRAFTAKIAHFQDATWKRSHKSSLSVPLAATQYGWAIDNESGLKNSVVSRLHNL